MNEIDFSKTKINFRTILTFVYVLKRGRLGRNSAKRFDHDFVQYSLRVQNPE